jgi:LysR family hydrogen peroxide-inducible transcriptional activator
MLPTLRQLQYLSLLAQHGSFSRAAQAAHVTQPTLSAGIQELERALGSAVVERGRGGAILTPVGEEAARRGGAILAAAGDLMEAAQAAGRPLSGRFRLGVIPTIAPFLLPRASPRLRERHPELKLFLREEPTARLLAALRAGALDAALIALPYDTAGLELEAIGADELAAVMPTGHPLADGSRLDPAALKGEPLILMEDGHCLREHAVGACDLSGPTAEAAFTATSLGTLVQMVGSGLGLSLLPSMAVQAGLAESAGVEVRRLSGPRPASREIALAWRAGSSRGSDARLLAETLREA